MRRPIKFTLVTQPVDGLLPKTVFAESAALAVWAALKSCPDWRNRPRPSGVDAIRTLPRPEGPAVALGHKFAFTWSAR